MLVVVELQSQSLNAETCAIFNVSADIGRSVELVIILSLFVKDARKDLKMKATSNTLNLVPAIREIEHQISKMEGEFAAQIAPYKRSLTELRRINTACEACGGEGKVLRSRACAEDDRPDPNDPTDWRRCEVCHGTGLARIPSVAPSKN